MAGVPTSDCERHRQDLSAFADETLSARRWEQVGYHLAGCRACRSELAAIREVRRTLQHPGTESTAIPRTLSERLHDIAGDHIHAPLYMAAGPRCALPTKRTKRNRRLLQSSAAVMAVLASVLVIAFLVAPEPPVVTNAVTQAREQFLLSTTALNVNEAVGAVLMAHERGAALGGPEHRSARSTMVSTPQRITRATAAAMLEGDRPTHSGVQRVWISDGASGFRVTDVQVDQMAGEGSSLVVLDASGSRFMSWFVPSTVCCEMDEGPPWSFWKYEGMDQVAGRWANVIEARDQDDRRVARWWVDRESSLVLWSERYDNQHKPTLISGFIRLTMGEAHLSETGAELAGMESVTSSGSKGWCQGLDHCPTHLGGLPLVAHSTSDVRGGTSMRLFYFDGFQGLSVAWSQGQLHGTLNMTDDTPGLPRVAVWQSRDGIVSVATNGSGDLLDEAAAQLPGEREWRPTVWERIGRGLSRLAGIH